MRLWKGQSKKSKRYSYSLLDSERESTISTRRCAHQHLLLGLKEDHLQSLRARVQECVLGEGSCGHRRWNAGPDVEGDLHPLFRFVATRVDGDLITLFHVDQMVSVVMHKVLRTRLHRQHACDPGIVFPHFLVALWGHFEGAKVALGNTTGLTIWVWLHKDRTPSLCACVFHLVCHGWEDWGRAGWDFNLFGFRTRRFRDLELDRGEEVHRVNGVLVGHILGPWREIHFDEPCDPFNLR